MHRGCKQCHSKGPNVLWNLRLVLQNAKKINKINKNTHNALFKEEHSLTINSRLGKNISIYICK